MLLSSLKAKQELELMHLIDSIVPIQVKQVILIPWYFLKIQYSEPSDTSVVLVI